MPRSDLGSRGGRKAIARRNVSSGPSKEIAGLKKKMKMTMMKMMTPGSQDSRVWEFLHEALKVRRGPLGLTCRDIWTSGVFW